MIGLYVFGFLLGTFKFMFAAAFLLVAASEAEIPISYWEVVISTFLGAFVSFNVFFFFSGLLMERAKEKKIKTYKSS